MATYIRLLVIPVKDVVEAMLRGDVFFKTEKGQVAISSIRMRTYTKGTDCVHCGRQGSYFAMETFARGLVKSPHLNLYCKQGPTATEIMMTSDHILAKSRGGSNNDLGNRQPMCCVCNSKKGSFDTVEEGLRASKDASKAARVLSRPKRLEKAISSSTYCIKQLEAGDTSKDWRKTLQHKLYDSIKLERALNNEQDSESILFSRKIWGG